MSKTPSPTAGVLDAAKTIADLAAFSGAPDDATTAVTLGELRALARALSTADGPTPATPGDLKAWRERRGLSVAAAARSIGCHRNAWAKWESGESPIIPKYISLALAAVAYGLPDPVDPKASVKAN